MIKQKIGFLGAGSMAEALIRGLIGTGNSTADKMLASDINEIRLAYMSKNYGIAAYPQNTKLVQDCRLLILAVKPQQAADVLEEIRTDILPEQHTLISIAAGISTSTIEKIINQPVKVVRVMPNTPACLQAGAAAFCLGQYAGESEMLLTRLLFESIGIIVGVEEPLMNAVTALSGSGPAYVFKLCEMMTTAGMDMGIPRKETEQLAVQTIWGAARMLTASGQSAAELRKAVTSPRGTTQAALESLANSDFEQVFQKALFAGRDRGQELSPTSQKEGEG